MPRKVADQKPKDAKKSLKLFLVSLKPFRLPIIFAIIFAISSNILALLSPKILGNMTNSAYASITETGSLDLEPIKLAATQLIVIYLVSALLGYFQTFLLARASDFYTKSLRSRLM